VRVKLAVFLDCEGIIHHEFQLNGQMVNKEYYLKVMEMLRGSEENKAWFVEGGKKWLLHQGNAAVHFSLLIQYVLTKHEMTLFPQPL
jgi:hypothetical protein